MIYSKAFSLTPLAPALGTKPLRVGTLRSSGHLHLSVASLSNCLQIVRFRLHQVRIPRERMPAGSCIAFSDSLLYWHNKDEI